MTEEEIYEELEITHGKPPRTTSEKNGAPDKPCGVGCADVNPKLLLNDT